MALTASDCFRLKYLHMLEVAGEAVLTYILKCGTNSKSPTDPLNEYLKKLPPDSTAYYNKKMQEEMIQCPIDPQRLHDKHLKKYFNGTERERIKEDPSCNSFDITLLFKAIQIACEKVASKDDSRKWTTSSGEMEYLIWQIKYIRNETIHEKVMMSEDDILEKIRELKKILVKALEATKVRYGRSELEFEMKKAKVLTDVKDIEEERIGMEEIVKKSANKLLLTFKAVANSELQGKLQKAADLDPLQFLRGYEDKPVDVQKIFSRIEVIGEREGKASSKERTDQVDYLNLIKFTQAEWEGRPQILLIEGDAGSGKTTLVTFLLSEWLKEECDRRMKGLNHYDLLLRIVCREVNRSRLDSMLEWAMPDAYMKYGRFLLPLLKKCRVLILIDGLDERNEVSCQLLEDIMSEGNDSPSLTAVCTSRPEAVEGFKDITPVNYQTFHVKLVGIPVEERTKVVLKHYEWLTKTEPRDTSTASLMQAMEEIAWMEVFRLPLNLLFLAKMFHCDSKSVKPTINQYQLYQFIHMWCKEKLRKNLSSHFKLTDTLEERKKKIDTISKEIYLLALQGLLEHRIYLTKKDVESLHASCKKEGLPKNKVIPAFYSLRREVTYGVPKEWYCTPHKGLQDFYAAKCIFEQLHAYEDNISCILLNSKVQFKELLSGQLRNMFCHLLGLLVQQENQVSVAIKDTVDYLQMSGVESIDEWLSVLADTSPAKIHTTALERVAYHIKNSPEEEITIRDGTVRAAAVLLPLIPPRRITITLETKSARVYGLPQALRGHTIIRLMLQHHYTHPHEAATSDHLLRQLPGMRNLQWFQGHLNAEHLPLLPQQLQLLHLVLRGSDHTRSLLRAFLDVQKSYPKLGILRIHVPVTEISPDAILQPLPDADNFRVLLDLSSMGESEMEVACHIAKNLCPIKNGYTAIMFPHSRINAAKWQDLLNLLANAGLRVRVGIRVPNTNITKQEEAELNTFAKNRTLGGFESWPEDFLWSLY